MIGIDFFCGAGGTTCGLFAAGIEIICGVDIDFSVKQTYEQNKRRNGTSCEFLNKNITELGVHCLDIFLANRRDNPVIFSGCPPCQPFTNINTTKASQGDSRSLALSFLDQVRNHLPEYVLMENVPGINHQKYGTVFDEFLLGLRELDYFYDYGILNARDFGVPQSRRRMIVVASRLAKVSLPPPTHGPRGTFPYVNSSVALQFPAIPAGACHVTIRNHNSAYLTDINLRRIQSILAPGGSRCEWEEDLQLNCYRNHNGHTDVYGRIDSAKPAPTLTTRFNSLSNGRFGHPTEHRALSLREGAALQTFPNDYIFYAPSDQQIAKHIGNAVPVLLATALGEAITAHYAQQMNTQI